MTRGAGRREAQRQRQQGGDAAQLARRTSAGCRRGGSRVPHGRCAWHHGASRAPTRGTSRPTDVRDIAGELRRDGRDRIQHRRRSAPRPAGRWSMEVRPNQCTLVPVRAGEITSQAGWPPDTPVDRMRRIVGDLQGVGIRVSVFVDPEPAAVRWAASLAADRVELYTEPFARAFARRRARQRRRASTRYAAAATLAYDARPRRQCGSRSRSGEPRALPDAATPRRGVDRPRAYQPRALRRTRAGRA